MEVEDGRGDYLEVYVDTDGTYDVEAGNGCEGGMFTFPSLDDLTKFTIALSTAVCTERGLT